MDFNDQVNDASASSSNTNNGINVDRRKEFVIDDDPKRAPCLFLSTKSLRASINKTGERRMAAIAVRENGTSRFSRGFRFTHIVPASV